MNPVFLFFHEQNCHQRQCDYCHGCTYREIYAEADIFHHKIGHEEESYTHGAGYEIVFSDIRTFADYAAEVTKRMEAAGIRAELDDRNEKLGYRIREAQLSKVPYMIVVGEDEMKADAVTVRARTEGEGGKFSVDEFIAKVVNEIETKKH